MVQGHLIIELRQLPDPSSWAETWAQSRINTRRKSFPRKDPYLEHHAMLGLDSYMSSVKSRCETSEVDTSLVAAFSIGGPPCQLALPLSTVPCM